MALFPTIPTLISVHLGRPSNNASNVTISFPDYIKNVASSEIYPTWPESALRANIYSQISFALNRIYLQHYPSLGYEFDITNSTAFDQSFVLGRDIFENISQIVDEIFNSYVKREGNIEPLFTQYCDGIETQCEGLSQWGTVDLANQGYSAEDILKHYFGNDIEIVKNVDVEGSPTRAPSRDLKFGSVGNPIRQVQIRLERIRRNYPAITKIISLDGFYGEDTVSAVSEFQSIFNLPVTGVTDSATWYKILYVFTSVKRLSELNSEGLLLNEVTSIIPEQLKLGDAGYYVRVVQYYLQYVSTFNERIQYISIDGIYGPLTDLAVRQFQREYGLPETGIIDLDTISKLYEVYRGLVASLPVEFVQGQIIPFPGITLHEGSMGEDVRVLQEYLNFIQRTGEHPNLPVVVPDGDFGPVTREAVQVMQRDFGFPETGTVNGLVWQAIAEEYLLLYNR